MTQVERQTTTTHKLGRVYVEHEPGGRLRVNIGGSASYLQVQELRDLRAVIDDVLSTLEPERKVVLIEYGGMTRMVGPGKDPQSDIEDLGRFAQGESDFWRIYLRGWYPTRGGVKFTRPVTQAEAEAWVLDGVLPDA